MKDREVIAGASAYEKKYFFNPKFQNMPENFQSEIKGWIIPIAEKVHGILTMGYEGTGEVYIEYASLESDYHFDEIGAALEVKKFQGENSIMLQDLKIWYRTFFTEEGAVLQEIAIKIQQGKSIKEILAELEEIYTKEQMENVKKILKQFDE